MLFSHLENGGIQLLPQSLNGQQELGEIGCLHFTSGLSNQINSVLTLDYEVPASSACLAALRKDKTVHSNLRELLWVWHTGCRTRLAPLGLAKLMAEMAMHRTWVNVIQGQEKTQLSDSSVGFPAS